MKSKEQNKPTEKQKQTNRCKGKNCLTDGREVRGPGEKMKGLRSTN